MKISIQQYLLLPVLLAVPSVAWAPTATTSSSKRLQRSMIPLSMAASGSMPCRPIGIGHAAPKTIITNVDMESVVETSDEWIQTRTGIAQRRVLTDGESLRSLGIEASKNALAMAGIKAEDIDIVICATSSPDDMFGDATAIAAEIGCSTDTVAFDLTAACSGFLFGTVTAGKFLSSPGGKLTNALVIGADALSRWVDWDDRNSCILFGDGAGAMVITNQGDEADGLLGYSAHSNGHGYGDLNCLYKGNPRPVSTPEPVTLSSAEYSKLAMNGQEVYKFATREVPRVVEEALEQAGMTADDVDWLLLHQANIRIMEVVAKRLKIPFEKVITNLSDYGNTSAGSIPIALSEAVASGKVKKGDVIACAGFGAGLSWGSAIMRWG
ncbi:3-oxoacyl-synthase [Nitzschia inconspicua]|uniref:beta-ketoacyl-[acyl-carrier-protein] synthase III n=1 Tax=Nitzschia inconspicua TaxID=303405 RepID=A0A9K3KWZ4_9STRA|nr:3-oxoacyl-synthase [Nitzschia inconspicua]